MNLGNWAVIDIETTGIDAGSDSIIDLGYLQFDGLKLVKKYSSLVKFEGHISQFIRELTGITPKMLSRAPRWSDVEDHLLELEGHALLAHNASFEEKFLGQYFEKYDDGDALPTSFEDSLPFFALLNPQMSSLSLEYFILNWGLREGEVHRGYEDSLDLLKVMILEMKKLGQSEDHLQFLRDAVTVNGLNDYWFSKFLFLEDEHLNELASQIDFDWNSYLVARTKEEAIVEKTLPRMNTEFSGETIKDLFRNEELIQTLIPNYHYRDSQELMSLKAGQSFKNNLHALIQAPTGTGKTLGYLVPASLHALNSQEPTLIATGTKALQSQAVEKDIPLLRKITGLDQNELKVTKLVGSSNHLCELIYRQEYEDEQQLVLDESFEDAFAKTFFSYLFFLNSGYPYAKKITRLELPGVLKRIFPRFKEIENDISVDFRVCAGFNCPYKDSCSYMEGLKESKNSHLIVGNHSLMFSWPKGMNRPTHIVVDEAHKIEGEATSAFTVSFNEQEFTHFAKSLNNLQGVNGLFYLLGKKPDKDDLIRGIRAEVYEASQMIQDHLDPMSGVMEDYFKGLSRYTSEFWNETGCNKDRLESTKDGTTIINHLISLKAIIENLFQTIAPYLDEFERGQLSEENDVLALTRFEKFATQVEDFFKSLELLLSQNDEYLHVMKFHEKFGYEFSCQPINIGEFVHESLLKDSESVIFTSATLANQQGSHGFRGMEWASGYLYVDPTNRFKTGSYLTPIFDYKNNAKVLLCDDLPPIYDSQFVPKMMDRVHPIIEDLDGKTLILFSARARFEMAVELLLEKFSQKIPVFVQGLGKNVVEDFKRSPKGILIGMESFSEGIDIPGESLSLVVIDKIPDLRRDLIVDARRSFFDSSFGNEFVDYFLAERARRLHQKLGRLLRTINDRGVAIVFDCRVKRWKQRTYNDFCKLMEPYFIERCQSKEARELTTSFLVKEK